MLTIYHFIGALVRKGITYVCLYLWARSNEENPLYIKVNFTIGLTEFLIVKSAPRDIKYLTASTLL